MLKLTGKPELIAATDGKPARLKIVAYSGQPIYTASTGWVIVDVKGVASDATIPILDGHENKTTSLIGEGKPSFDKGQIQVDANIGPTQAGIECERLLKAGMQLQSSIGLGILKYRWLKAGDKIEVNGQTFDIDDTTMLVEEGELKEVSVLPLGADSQTTVNIAAGANMSANNVGDPVTLERDRVSQIIAACDGVSGNVGPNGKQKVIALRQQAIGSGMSVDEVNAGLLEVVRADRPQNPGIITGAGVSPSRSHLEAALMVRAGLEGAAEKAYGSQVLEASRPMHRLSLVDLAARSLQIAGHDTPHSRDGMLRAAFSVGDFAVALSNVAGKSLDMAYQAAPSPWRFFALKKTAANFKTQTSVRPTFALELDELPEHGEIKHGSFQDENYTWSISTYAKMLAIGRKSLIDDDLSCFSEVVPAMARAANRKLNDAVAKLILANENDFWGTSNANYLSGTETALAAGSMALAIAKLRAMRDADGNLIDAQPRVILTPANLEFTALELLESATMQRYVTSGSPSQPMGNPLQGVVRQAVDVRLGDSAYTGYSTTAWWLFSDPGSVVVGFLDNREGPTIETSDVDFSQLGVQMRVVHDWGVALGDHRLSVKMKGTT